MAVTYDPLATSTVSSVTTTINFTGISQSYTDLRLIITCPGFGSGQGFAGSRTNNHNVYSWYDGIRVTNTTASAGYDGRSLFAGYQQNFGTANTSNIWIFDINLYTDTSFNQPMMLAWGENSVGSSSQNAQFAAGYAAITTNITSVQAYNGGDWAVGTKATLYGIARA